MFGSEQSVVQHKQFLRWIYRIVGDFRYSIRLRAFYLSRLIPAAIAPKTILDAGCGEGQTSFYLGRRFREAEVIGIDVSPVLVERCNAIARVIGNGNLRFSEHDLLDASLLGQFDLIVCMEVLEHIEDYKRALDKLVQHLAFGGYLIIHTPAAGKYTEENIGLRRFIAQKSDDRSGYGEFHVRPGYYLDTLRQELETRGLIVEHSSYSFGALAMYAHTVYELIRNRSAYKLLLFPLLLAIGVLDWYLLRTTGGGIVIRAHKLPFT